MLGVIVHERKRVASVEVPIAVVADHVVPLVVELVEYRYRELRLVGWWVGVELAC